MIGMNQIRRDIRMLSNAVFELAGDGGFAGLPLFTFAESCTGGLVAASLVAVPGISAFFPGSIVTYDNRAKIEKLSVVPETIETYGAVSAQCAAEMACGALRLFGTRLAVSVTGIAGPDGGSPEKPVGMVWIALASADGHLLLKRGFYTGRPRRAVQLCAARSAIQLLLKGISGLNI